MNQRGHRRAHAIAAVISAIAAVVAVGGGASAASRPVATQAMQATQALQAPQAREARAAAKPAATILLPNGDQLRVISVPGERPVYAVQWRARGFAGSLLGLTLGGTSYEIPSAAVPYLNRGLDPGLFSLRALASAESTGQLPLSIGYAGRLPAVPGVTITAARGGIARGYLTAESAVKFGAALARQFMADHSSGSYGQDGMFADGVTISLAGTAPERPAAAGGQRPQYMMHTLTVRGITTTGKPDTGDEVWVYNVDNGHLFGDGYEESNIFYDGIAKYSVPAGHYWAIAQFYATTATTIIGYFVDVLPQFTVRGNTTVTLDARAATSLASVATPRPAAPTNFNFTVDRADAKGYQVSYAWNPSFPEIGAWNAFWVSPTRTRPTVGTLQTLTSWQLVAPGGGSGYEYDLAVYGDGRVPPQDLTVRAADLAVVHSSYYSDVSSQALGYGFLIRYVVIPGMADVGVEPYVPSEEIAPPFQQNEYMTPGLTWVDTFTQDFYWGGQSDAAHVFTAGQYVSERWNAYPLHVAPNVNLIGAADAALGGTLASATRSGDTLWLDFTPFSDSTPGHTGNGYYNGSYLYDGGGSYAVYQNGNKIAGGSAGSATPDVFVTAHLRPGRSVLRFVLDASEPGSPFVLSTASSTVWTWRSAAVAGSRLPLGWVCGNGTRNCAVQPLLTLDYSVARLNLSGVAPPGAQQLTVTAAHLQLARASRITRVRVWVSFDGGKTWIRAIVTGRHGRYRAAFTAPADKDVTLRVTARDAAGGRITETITNGYATS